MEHNTRFSISKVLIICLWICIGTALAFKVFKKTQRSYSVPTEITINKEISTEAPDKKNISQVKIQNSELEQYPQVATVQISTQQGVTEKLSKLPENNPIEQTKNKQIAPPQNLQESDALEILHTLSQSEQAPHIVPIPIAPTISIKNNIHKEMTGYKKFGKTWYPDEYSLTIDSIAVQEGEEITVPMETTSCKLVFSYDFRPMGRSYKKGTEELVYKIAHNTQRLEITFSWYKKPTIIVQAF